MKLRLKATLMIGAVIFSGAFYQGLKHGPSNYDEVSVTLISPALAGGENEGGDGDGGYGGSSDDNHEGDGGYGGHNDDDNEGGGYGGGWGNHDHGDKGDKGHKDHHKSDKPHKPDKPDKPDKPKGGGDNPRCNWRWEWLNPNTQECIRRVPVVKKNPTCREVGLLWSKQLQQCVPPMSTLPKPRDKPVHVVEQPMACPTVVETRSPVKVCVENLVTGERECNTFFEGEG